MNSPTWWIKLYTEIVRDRKMVLLSDRLWRRCVELMCIAGDTGAGGRLPPPPDMAFTLRISEPDLLADLEALATWQFVTRDPDGTWVVTHFAARQAPATTAQRQARSRARTRASPSPRDQPVTKRDTFVTKRDANVTPRDIEQNRTEPDSASHLAYTTNNAESRDIALAGVGVGVGDGGNGDRGTGDDRALLAGIGVTEPALSALLKRPYPPGLVRAWVSYADRQPGLTNRAGFVVKKLALLAGPPPDNNAPPEAKRWFTAEEETLYFLHPPKKVPAP